GDIAARAWTQGKGRAGRITPRRLVLGLVVAHALVNLTFLKAGQPYAARPGLSPYKTQCPYPFHCPASIEKPERKGNADRRAQRNRHTPCNRRSTRRRQAARP